MQLWSDNSAGVDAISDVGLPPDFNANGFTIHEDVNGVAVYNPDFSLGDFRYTVFSDGDTTVPEPSVLALFGAGAIGLLAVRRRKSA